MVEIDFNAAEIEPSQDFDLIPDGWYLAQITATDRKAMQSGAYLAIEHTILGPKFVGRKVWARLNLWIQEDTEGRAKAKQISQSQMSSICRALGKMQVRTTEELHNRPLQIKVGHRPAKDGYDASNEVKAWKPAEGVEQPTLPAAGNGPASQAAKPSSAPWRTA